VQFNIDDSFSSLHNKVGIDICVKEEVAMLVLF